MPDETDLHRRSEPVGGTIIADRYKVERLIARGGMAAVYLAKHITLNRPIALKILSPPPEADDAGAFEERFRLEAETLASLDHRNIVILHDFGETTDARFFLAMEYVDGSRLSDLLRDGPVPVERTLKLIVQVCQALRYAHKRGVVHRDLKPSNLLIRTKEEGEEQIKVVDFGLVKLTEADQSITRAGLILGSPHCMSPEQVKGIAVDHRADIYSVGATLFASVTGETPKDLFAAELDPSLYRGVPRPLEAVIRRACAYWATDRYPSAEAMKADLELTISMMGEGKRVKDHSKVSFRTDPGSFSAGPPPPPVPAARVGAPRPQKPKSQPESVTFLSGRGLALGLGVGVVAIVGLMGWMVQSSLDRVREEAPVVAAEIPAQKRKGRMGSPEMENVEALRPAIDHSANQTVVLGETYKVVAEIPGSGMYDSVQAWYRPVGQSEWSRAGLRKVGDGYEGSIATTRLFVDGLEYWIEAKPYSEGMPTLKVASASNPIRVDVVVD